MEQNGAEKKSPLIGLVGVVGIWVTAGLALPFVNVRKEFTPEQLMVFRGFLPALIAFVLLRGKIGKVDKYTWLIGLTLPLATLGLFEGIRNWGVGPTLIVVTGTPVVNFFIGRFLKRPVSDMTITSLIIMICGVALACKGGHFNWPGFLWSVEGTIANGILYELFARAKTKPLQKCFFSCFGMGALGLLLSFADATPWVAETFTLPMTLQLVTFAFVGGFLYWIANQAAFKHLETMRASVLAQGETPAAMIGAYLLLGEKLSMNQWVGTIIALAAAVSLVYATAKEAKEPAAVATT